MVKKKVNKPIYLYSFFLLLFFLLFLAGCGDIKQKSDILDADIRLQERETNISRELVYKDSLSLKYAKKFAVDFYQDDYALVSVADGRRYLLVPEGKEAPEDLAGDIRVLKQPLNQIYLVASAAMDMFRALDALDTIRFCGLQADGWYIDEAKNAMEEGKIAYAGKYSMPDYEFILSEGCSLAVENNMISHTPEVIEKLESFEIPVFIDLSSYESHPLGRVEWIKLYGVLLKKEAEAEALFANQEATLKRVTEEEPSGKTVAFFYITNNGMVNVRCSSDYVPKMIALAGGTYIFEQLEAEESNRSSVTMQMEEFYQKAKDADYLIYNSTIQGELNSIEELLKQEALLGDFKAVQEGNVWCTTKDLYQQSMSIGGMIEDFHTMLSGACETSDQKMHYLFPLKQEEGNAKE